MPIYEYHCNECGKEFEKLVFGDECPACPSCESDKVCRLMSRCGFKSTRSLSDFPTSSASSSSSSSCGGCTASSCAGCGH